MIFFSVSMASNGMVNSAMTRMLLGVRNLAYIGMWSMKKSVSPMKFLPHDSRMLKMVAAKSAHFIGPFTTKRPSMKSASTKAPT